MTRETFYSIIIQLTWPPFKPHEMMVAFHYGGESLLHPHFREFAEAAHLMRFKELGIATNGTLLDTRMNNVLLSNFDAVAVSLHKGPKLHESIGNLVNLVKQRGKGNYEPNIRANIVAEEFSQQELDEIVELLNGKVDRVRCVTYISEDMQTANDETVEGCPGPYRYMAILWNGDTLPCCHILSPGKWTLGNISDSSLLEVWNGHEYARLRKGNVEGTPCMGCQVKRL